MHRLSSKSSVTRLRMAALLLILAWMLVPAAIGVLGYAMAQQDRELTILGGSLAGAGLLIGLAQMILASKARCPLCMTPPLASKRCSKHREARTLLGSFRLRAALSMLTRGYFRCPFCNEPTAMEPRQRRNRPLPLEARARRR